MASIALMIGSVILNAAAFTSRNYLAKYLSRDGKAALEEKTQHDKALKAYQVAMVKYTHAPTKLLDWIETNREIKDQARHNFTNTNYSFRLYNQAHPDWQISPLKEPQLKQIAFCWWQHTCAWLCCVSFSLNFRGIK